MALLTKAESDWLASDPIFYNEKTGKISRSMLEVIDYDHFEFDAEGLNDYLKFGYSILGQTMVKNVKFLLPNMQIELVNGKLVITEKEDPVERNLRKRVEKGEDVIDLILHKTKQWADNQKRIILPLSGGYDSRLLSYALKDDEKVEAYTYGVSEKQDESFEVYNARKIAQINNINWTQIYLGQFHENFEDFYQLYGPSVNIGGAYQIEFYRNIRGKDASLGSVLSGIIGDLWAGNVKLPQIGSAKELYKLAYAHGAQILQDVCKLQDSGERKEAFFATYRDKLNDEKWRNIFFARFKLIFLSNLCRIPGDMGYNVWSPFLDCDIAMAMLNISETEREKRKWQTDFFREKHLDLEKIYKDEKIDRSNTLSLYALRQIPLPILNKKVLATVFDECFIEKVNREIVKKPIKYLPWYKGSLNGFADMMIHFGNRGLRQAYQYYSVLKPIEYLLTTVYEVN